MFSFLVINIVLFNMICEPFHTSKYLYYKSFSPTICSKKYSVRDPMTMHFGHDHSHSHNHKPPEKISFRKIMKKTENRVILTTAAYLLIRVFLRKKFDSLETSIFTVFAASLSLLGAAKKALNRSISRMASFKRSLMRHSSPINSEYFVNNENMADRVTLVGVVCNIMLSIIKLAGGIMCHSAVLIADAGHSLSDLLSDFITLWAVQIARIPPDSDHPYG